MTKRELKNIERSYEEAGPVKDRVSFLMTMLPLLNRDILRLKDTLTARKDHFYITLETWLGFIARADQRPSAIPEQIRLSSKYFWSAVSGVLGEASLAGWIFAQMGGNALLGVLSAILASIFFEAIVTFILKNVSRPLETLRRIKNWVLVPSAIIFGLSFALLLLARTTTGEAAVALLDVFNICLWTVTLGLLGVVGSCLAASEVLSWSKRDQKEYDAIEIEEAMTRSTRDRFTRELALLTRQTNSTVPGQLMAAIPRSSRLPVVMAGSHAGGNGRKSRVVQKAVPVVLALLLPLLQACAKPEAVGAVTDAPVSADYLTSILLEEESTLNIYIDVSLSVDDMALQSFAQNLILKLPQVIERWGVSKVKIYTFDQQGWNCHLRYARDLPKFRLAPETKREKGEIGALLPNIADSLDEQDKEQRRRQHEKALFAYRDQLKLSLSGLEDRALLPVPGARPPRCTDLNGLFYRIYTDTSNTRQLALVLTDGAENCDSEIKPVPVPKSNMGLVIVLLEEKAGEQRGGARSYRLFEERKSSLSRALSWATIIPSFDEEYNDAFSNSLTKMAVGAQSRMVTLSKGR